MSKSNIFCHAYKPVERFFLTFIKSSKNPIKAYANVTNKIGYIIVLNPSYLYPSINTKITNTKNKKIRYIDVSKKLINELKELYNQMSKLDGFSEKWFVYFYLAFFKINIFITSI